MALSNYIEETRDLVRDSGKLFYSDKQLTRYINISRRMICKTMACLPTLITGQSFFGAASQAGFSVPGATIPGALPGNQPGAANSVGGLNTTSNGFQTIANTESYSYSYAERFMQAANAGTDKILDVMDVACSYGTYRPQMNWMDWGSYQAYARSANLVASTFPVIWSTLGDATRGRVFLWPQPSQNLEMEWFVSASPKALYTNNDLEVLPETFWDAVPYFAAFRAYLNSQRTGNAMLMLNHFTDFLGIDRVSADRGKIPTYYWTDI